MHGRVRAQKPFKNGRCMDADLAHKFLTWQNTNFYESLSYIKIICKQMIS